MNDKHPKKGDRYVVTTAFQAIVLTHWFAPFTGGSEKLLPAGLEFIVEADPPPTATAVVAKPDPYQRWETILVDDQDRLAEKYGGGSLIIQLARLVTHCSRP
jgi:hypothetical protein